MSGFASKHEGVYVVNMKKKTDMFQMNTMTGKKRKIRRRVDKKRPRDGIESTTAPPAKKGGKQPKAESTGEKNADDDYKIDVFGPWPSPMDKGNSWIQFTRHFRKEINSFMTKCFGDPKKSKMKSKTYEAVFYAALKMLNVISKYEKYKAEIESPTGTSNSSPEHLSTLKDLKQKIDILKVALGIGSQGKAKECFSGDDIPAVQALEKRTEQQSKEQVEMKAKLGDEEKKKRIAQIKAAIAVENEKKKALEERVAKIQVEKKELRKKEEEGKKQIEALSWDDVISRPNLIAKIKAYMSRQLELSIEISDLQCDVKGVAKTLKDLEGMLKAVRA